ncbi:hypothetical protein Tco_0490487 [Tanacetum coccineum]
MENSKKGNLPLHHGIKISKDLCLKTNEELGRMSRVPYASANPDEVVFMEYLVNISKRQRILVALRRYLKDFNSKDQYAVSIKEDTVYPCLHSLKTTEE